MVNKFVLPILLGMISTFSVSSAVGTKTYSKTATENTTMADRLENRLEMAARDYSSEVDVPAGKLTVSAATSTHTSLGQSFSFSFSTGGQGFCDSTTTYLLAPDDESFDEYYKAFLEMTVEEREAITADWEAGLYETVHFNSYVFSITGSDAVKDVYIPRDLTRNHIFSLDVTKMGINVVRDWTNVNSITIPEEVTDIYSESFQNVPSTMVFNVEAESKPGGWADDWAHGATVHYGVSFPESKAEPLSKAGASKYGDDTQNYILGWYPKEGERLPLTLEYKVRDANGTLSDVRYFDFSPSTESSIYECVGYMLNDYNKSLYCDVELNEGEVIEFDSLVLHNLYRSKMGPGDETAIPEPNTEQAYRIVPTKAYNHVYSIDDFIDLKFKGISSFSGFTAVDLNVDISETNAYKLLKPNYYNNHLSEIEKGTVKIRYRLVSLTLCSFRITYAQGNDLVTKDVKIATPVTQFKIAQQKGNRVSFLLKNSDVGAGFNAQNIRSLSFVGLYVAVDLMGARAPIARSGAVTRFGYLSIMPYTEKANLFNIDLMLILIAIGYALAFAGGSVGLYFFLKNKYKNDEFRRMNTKNYIKKALLFFGGAGIVIFDIIFIVLRGTAMNNAIVVYNPVDAYIIVLSVLSVVIIGYFIKYLVGVVKTEKERRRTIKLKLNEDVEDDGTN